MMNRNAFAVPLLALALAGCNTSYGYFQDEPDPVKEYRDTSLFGSMLTMTGVIPEQRSTPQYKPRSPLAMPNAMDLPSPESASAAETAVNFPTDHDEKERQRRQALYELGEKNKFEGGIGDSTADAVVPAAEANAMRKARSGSRKEGAALEGLRSMREPIHRAMSLAERSIDISSRSRSAPVLDDSGQAAAPRTQLIQPPSNLRTPVETAAIPEKKDIENSEWIDKQLYRRFSPRDEVDRNLKANF